MREALTTPTGTASRMPSTPAPRPTGPPRWSGLPPGPTLPGPVQTALWAAQPEEFAARCRRRHGSLFSTRIFPFGDVIYVADPTLIRSMLTGPSDLFRAGEANAPIEFVVGARSLLTLDGADHAAMRRKLGPTFRGVSLRRNLVAIAQIVADAVATWPESAVIRLDERLARITFDVIVRIVFGISDDAHLATLRELVPQLLAINPMLLLFPQLRREILGRGPWARFTRLRQRIDDVIYSEIRAARQRPGGTGDDVLSVLLHSEESAALTDEEIRDHLVTLLAVGHETSTVAMSWLFERLLRTPHAYARLRAEAHGGDETAYLDATVSETLRVRPPTLDVARIASAPVEMGGYTLPAGTMIAISLSLLHSAPDLHPDPGRFRPERFLGTSPPAYHFLPFGGGTHRCLGANFAVAEIREIVRAVVREVDLVAPRAAAELPRARGPMVVPSRGTQVRVVRRCPR